MLTSTVLTCSLLSLSREAVMCPREKGAVGKCGSGASYSAVGREFMLVSQQYDPSRKRKSHQSVYIRSFGKH